MSEGEILEAVSWLKLSIGGRGDLRERERERARLGMSETFGGGEYEKKVGLPKVSLVLAL